MRSFIALPIPDPIAEDLAEFAARLKLGRPQPSENMHITLAFLDEQPVAKLEQLHDELEYLSWPAVHVGIEGMQVLGGRASSVLALRVSGVDDLHRKVLGAVRNAGITLPRRKFRAHVTLVRLPRHPSERDRSMLQRALEAPFNAPVTDVTLDQVSLYRSDLRPDGASYERLADYPLAR